MIKILNLNVGKQEQEKEVQMKINVKTSTRTIQNLDTKGIKLEDLNYHLVKALLITRWLEDNSIDGVDYVGTKKALRIEGWAPASQGKNKVTA